MTPDQTLRAGLAAMAMLVLAGCTPMLPKPGPDLGPWQKTCESDADADPNIKVLYVQMVTAPVPQVFKDNYTAARSTYVRDCVRIRGGLPIGGVQPVIR
jgi:hypothetical protein